jgi:protein-tyrosine phosphatase
MTSNNFELMKLSEIKTICVVCAGNICRSPIGEVVLKDRLDKAGLDIFVDSAGTGDWHEGEDANQKSIKVLRDSGYEISHNARQFKKHWFEQKDLILVMDFENKRNLTSIAPKDQLPKIKLMRAFDPLFKNAAQDSLELEVPDPYHEPLDAFYEVLDMVEQASDGLVAEILKAQRN